MARADKSRGNSRTILPSRPAQCLSLAGDRRWKELCALGNAAFAAKRWIEAEQHYAAALAEAERIFESFRRNDPVPGADAAPMLVVSISNIAENWLCMGKWGVAGDALIGLSRTLCETMADENLEFDLRTQCYVHLKRALLELMEKLPRAGMASDTVTLEFDHAQTAALRFLERNAFKH